VGYGRPREEVNADGEILEDPDAPRYIDWATLMQRSFGIDVTVCEKCQGHLKVIALIDQPAVIKRILSHLGLPAEVPKPKPARPPPTENEHPDCDAAEQLPLDFGDMDGLDDPNAYAE
jgi:hypothetical protein